MKQIKILFEKSFQCFAEVLVFLPILLTIAIYIYPQLKIGQYFIYLFLLCLCGVIIRGTLDIANRQVQIVIGTIVGIFIIYIHALRPFGTILFLITGSISYLRGIVYMEADWDLIFPGQMWWIAFIFYAFASLLYRRVAILNRYFTLILICGFIQVVISLMMINHRQLGIATLIMDKKPVVPSSIKRQNRILLFINLIIITVFATLNRIRQFGKMVVQYITTGISKLMAYLYSLLGSEGALQGGLETLPNFPSEGEIAKSNSILELIVDILTIALVIIAATGLIYIIYNGIKRLGLILIKWLRRLFEEKKLYEDNYGYIDEEETLLDIKEVRARYAKRIEYLVDNLLDREPKWEDLTSNSERIRYIYKRSILQFLKEGYIYRPYMTPTEIKEDIKSQGVGQKTAILDRIVPIYNKVRYGYSDIDDSDVEKLYRLYRDS